MLTCRLAATVPLTGRACLAFMSMLTLTGQERGARVSNGVSYSLCIGWRRYLKKGSLHTRLDGVLLGTSSPLVPQPLKSERAVRLACVAKNTLLSREWDFFVKDEEPI
jgi:hypothetical protein